MKQARHRVLLVEPPFNRLFKDSNSLDRYPLALGYLAGAIRGMTDWDVTAYNADFHPDSQRVNLRYLAGAGFDCYLDNLRHLSGRVWDEIRSTMLEYEPTVVGISTKSQNFASACLVASLAKLATKHVIVIVGGPHPSMVGAEVLNHEDIDVGVRGEGENTIVELLGAIEAGRQFRAIQGIVYRNGSHIVENAPRAPIRDLDSLRPPHEDAAEVLKDYERYPQTAFSSVFATRGCPYNCFFCGSRNVWGRQVRFRSAENVVTELRSLQDLGVRFVQFQDDVFGIDRRYVNELCHAIAQQLPDLRWSCELHVNLVDDSTISTMKAAGCRQIYLGIESGNDEILKAMRKGYTIEEALSASQTIRKHGISLGAFFMIGFPQETESSLNDTVAAMRRIKCQQLVYSIFTPYPGTEAFEFCREEGTIDNNYDVSLYNHQSPLNCFSTNIAPERFRVLASKVEAVVDRRNTISLIRGVVSRSTLAKIQDLGVRRSLRQGINVLMGR